MHLYLVRHGMASHNLPQGAAPEDAADPLPPEKVRPGDTPLTAQGRIQADLLGRRLADVPFGAVLSSPLRRAMETARRALGDRSAPAIECLPDLMEVGCCGEAWIDETAMRALYGNVVPCGAEQPTGAPAAFAKEPDEAGLRGRAERVRAYLLRRFTGDVNVLVVSHGAFMGRFLIPALAGVPGGADRKLLLCAENASLTVLTVEAGKPVIAALLNDVSHLGKYRSRDPLRLTWETLEGAAEPLPAAELAAFRAETDG